jgi:hypothetical protein
MYRLAETLHKTLGEIEAIPAHELAGWVGYFLIKEEEHKRWEAEMKAKSQPSSFSRRPPRTFDRR